MKLIQQTLASTPCVDCGLLDLLLLEFDHIGDKRGNVIAMARRGCALKTLQNEIARCQVRCANCHRRRTQIEVRGLADAA